jgi:hypothetical protein
MSEEHYLQDGLGEFTNYELLVDRVCAGCNTRIGKIEEPFLRTGYIAALRWQLGIRGKDGSPPDPFHRGASGVPRLRAPLRIAAFPYEILYECDPGTQTGRPLRQIIFQDRFQNIRPFYVTDWMLTACDKLADSLRKEDLEEATPIHGFAHPDEIARIKALVESIGLKAPSKWNWEGNEFDPHWERITVAAFLPLEAFCRSIAKIAFHYTLKMFPDFSGHEPEFEPVKRFIWEGGENRFVMQDFSPPLVPKCWSHLLDVVRSYEAIVATVHLFVPPPGGMATIPPRFKVLVGRDPSRIIRPLERRAHQFAMSQLGAPNGPIGEMVDLLSPC